MSLDLIIGVIIGYTLNHVKGNMWKWRKPVQRYWGSHPYQKRLIVVLMTPFVFVIVLPIDWVMNGETFRDYINIYKQVW